MRKMLKHDLNSVWKIWRIMAPIVLVTAVICGFAMRLIEADISWPEPLDIIVPMFSSLVSLTWPMLMSAFSIVTLILIVIRYYKNFFTDEGYLTFTLPVSRTKLLNSKIIMAFFWLALTVAVCMVAYGLYYCSAFGEEIWEFFSEIFSEIEQTEPDTVPPPDDETLKIVTHVFVFFGELLIFSAVASAADVMFLLLCVTIGAVIVKRAKLVLGLGLYYVVNYILVAVIYAVVVIAMAIMMSTSLGMEMSEKIGYLLLHGIPWLGVVMFAGLGVGSYVLNLKLIQNKLNLP